MKSIVFPEIGIVHFVVKPQCRRLIVRVKSNGEVYVSMPRFFSERAAQTFVTQHVEWIKKQQNRQKQTSQLITHSQPRITHFHDLELVKGVDNSLRIIAKNGVIKAILPKDYEVEHAQVQQELITTLESVLRKEAHIYIPQRVEYWAKEFGFDYSQVKISGAKTRWGSCSSQKRLSFSLYVMTLPFHLIDFVILHELCHTKHLNHSSDFYTLHNACLLGKLKLYEAEIKHLPMSVFPKFTPQAE